MIIERKRGGDKQFWRYIRLNDEILHCTARSTFGSTPDKEKRSWGAALKCLRITGPKESQVTRDTSSSLHCGSMLGSICFSGEMQLEVPEIFEVPCLLIEKMWQKKTQRSVL